MSKSRNLKAFLESSLNEIFKATVSDILESVEETLSEYQGRIQRVETENEELRRRLQRRDVWDDSDRLEAEERRSGDLSNENAVLKKPCTEKSTVSPKKQFTHSCPSGAQQTGAEQHKDPVHKSELGKKQGGECYQRASVDANVSTVTVGCVKDDPDTDSSSALYLAKTLSPLNLVAKQIKTESSDLSYVKPDEQYPHSADMDSRDSDSDVRVTIVSDSHVESSEDEDGHLGELDPEEDLDGRMSELGNDDTTEGFSGLESEFAEDSFLQEYPDMGASVAAPPSHIYVCHELWHVGAEPKPTGLFPLYPL
ncbi:zinc finger protein 271-like [Arapaima gigas]